MSVGLGIVPPVNQSVSPLKGALSAVCCLLLLCSACSGGLDHAWLKQCKHFEPTLCPAAGSEGLLQGGTHRSPAACRYKAPCRSLTGIAPKNYSKY